MLYVPCGDHHWAKEMKVDFLNYTGIDIVKELIEINNMKYATPKKRFVHLDICKDKLPYADWIFCRDLMQYLSYQGTWMAIKNIVKTKSRYLLASSQIDTKTNRNIATGGWRRLNQKIQPFYFPKPIMTIGENWNNKIHGDKALLLWDLDSIRQRPLEMRIKN